MSDDDDNVLTLADGTKISTRTGRPIRDRETGVAPGYVEVPTNTEAQQVVLSTRKRLNDLPDTPKQMNIVAAVAAYYMFGLDEFDTSVALECTETQVANIKMTEAFSKIVEAMTQNIVQSQSEDVRGMITQYSRDAAVSVINLMTSQDQKVALQAARDILDRAGHRPADIVEHRHQVEGGLVIEHVRKTDERKPIDIEFTVEDD